jgi:hypothetical protein
MRLKITNARIIAMGENPKGVIDCARSTVRAASSRLISRRTTNKLWDADQAGGQTRL